MSHSNRDEKLVFLFLEASMCYVVIVYCVSLQTEANIITLTVRVSCLESIRGMVQVMLIQKLGYTEFDRT